MENDRLYITDAEENKYSFRIDMLNYDFVINKLIKYRADEQRSGFFGQSHQKELSQNEQF